MKIILILSAILMLSCSSGNNQNMPIQPLIEYATNYVPCKSTPPHNAVDCIVGMEGELPPLPKKVAQILQNRKIDNELIIYNSLIASRLYSHHLVRAHQSYGINKKHPVWVVFEKYSEIPFNSEFETSSIIHTWLDKGNYKKHPLLKAEYEIMNREHTNIKNGIYWK